MLLPELERTLAEVPIIGILRNLTPGQALSEIDRLLAGGIRVIEVTIQHLDAIPTLEAVVVAGRRAGAVVGAGSVNSMVELEAAAAADVDFTVAPGLDLAVAEEAARNAIAHIPGVATASEVATARNARIPLLKAFPAQHLTPSWVKAIRGPFPDVRFLATGGLVPDDLCDWKSVGCTAIGVSANSIPTGWRFEPKAVKS